MNQPILTEEQLKTIPQETLVAMYMSVQSSLIELQKSVDTLSEQIKLMNQRQYGRKSETSSTIFHQEELELGFNEAEATEDMTLEEPEITTVIRHKKKGKKSQDLKKVTNHREVEIQLSDEELNERFGINGWKKLPCEYVTKLEHIPACFEVVTYKIGVYAAKDNETIIRAPRPTELWTNSIATPSLVASIIFAKYVNAVPLYRLERAYEQNEVSLSRATMANWMIKSSDMYLRHFYDSLQKYLLKERYIHADETPFQVNKDGRAAGSKSYMWVYRGGVLPKSKKIILYDYCPTRSYENPKNFLNGFKGTLITDGYQAYHKLANEDPDAFCVAGCWTHLKRKFAEYLKTMKSGKGTFSDIAVKKIQKIYHEDNKLKELKPKEKLQKRQEKIRPLVDDFFEWVKKNQEYVASESATGRAFAYAINQEKYLREFLDDENIPLDNNPAEQSIRPFTVGRKNWVMIDTMKGAEASAVLYSIVETAKANNLKIYEYLTYVLTELSKTIHDFTVEVPEKLMPWSEELPAEVKKN